MKREDMILIAVIAVILFIIFYRNSSSFYDTAGLGVCKEQDKNSDDNFLKNDCVINNDKKQYRIKITYKVTLTDGTTGKIMSEVLDVNSVRRKKGDKDRRKWHLHPLALVNQSNNNIKDFTITNAEFRCDCYPDKVFKFDPKRLKVYNNNEYTNKRMGEVITNNTGKQSFWSVRFD
jgi:hypothetical protein